MVAFFGLFLAFVCAFFGKGYFRWYLFVSWLAINLIIISSWWHFQYFRAYLNYDALQYIGGGFEGLKSVLAFKYKVLSIILLLSTGLLCLATIYFYNNNSYRTSGVMGFKIICLGLGIICFYSVNNVLDNLKSKNTLVLSPYYFHPVHAFLYSLDVYRESHYLNESWAYFRGKNSYQSKNSYIKDSIGDQQRGTKHHLVDKLTPNSIDKTDNKTVKPLNVIVITLESFRASFIGHYGSVDGLTPNFDHLAKRYITARHFYANSNFTIKAETSIYCGIFDHNARVSISENTQKKNLQCLPEILRNIGYQTYYFHGNNGRFYNRSEYLPELGFDHLYFHADQPNARKDNRQYIGWGLSDEDIYDIMLSTLEHRLNSNANPTLGSTLDVAPEQMYQQAQAKPFFAGVMSLSNHYPFNGKLPIKPPFPSSDENIELTDQQLFDNYRNTVFYTDYALGQFWQAFERSSLYDNTMVVITADHGIWSFGKDESELGEVLKNEEFFRVPLMIYQPQLTQPVEIAQVASQIDILPSVLALLNIHVDRNYYAGKNILENVADPWSIMTKSGEQFVRYKDKFCYIESLGCSGVQQQCFSTTDPSADSEPDSEPQRERCISVVGDLLRGGRVGDKIERTSDVTKSYDLVTYDNKRIFLNPTRLVAATHRQLKPTQRIPAPLAPQSLIPQSLVSPQ